MTLYYDEDPNGEAVEIGDHVELRHRGATYNGTVTKVHPRKDHVSVRYEDPADCTRQGTPRNKVTMTHVLAVDLVRRDG